MLRSPLPRADGSCTAQSDAASMLSQLHVHPNAPYDLQFVNDRTIFCTLVFGTMPVRCIGGRSAHAEARDVVLSLTEYPAQHAAIRTGNIHQAHVRHASGSAAGGHPKSIGQAGVEHAQHREFLGFASELHIPFRCGDRQGQVGLPIVAPLE